jgi:hypothetical protein
LRHREQQKAHVAVAVVVFVFALDRFREDRSSDVGDFQQQQEQQR